MCSAFIKYLKLPEIYRVSKKPGIIDLLDKIFKIIILFGFRHKYNKMWYKNLKTYFWNIEKKSAKPMFGKCVFYCFPKFHENSSKI